jgi:outer membrane receptor protein involved in Fe transport
MLEEVVVTARRREESLQDLPLSVAAITADTMQAQGVYQIEDISDHVPNLTFTTTDRRGIQALFIRGIGNDSTNNLTPVGAGLYIDGHYMPNTLGQMMSTLDIERIEVLRGPQGTLFGKNTTGGAVNIITAKPAPEFGASALIRAAEFGQADFRGMVNVPMGETLAGRFSVSKETIDGYYFNRTLNRDVGAIDVEAFAGSLRFTPNENWTVDLLYRINSQEDDNAPGQCGARPTQEQVDNLFHDGVPIDINLVNPQTGLVETYTHEGYLYTGTIYDEAGFGANQGIEQWGGAFTDEITDEEFNVGGHVERLYPGATLDYWNACDTDQAMGDFVTSGEKNTFLLLDNTSINLTTQWDSAGPIGGLDNLNIKLNLSSHKVEYNYQQDRDFTAVQVDAIGTPPLRGFGQQQENEQLELLFTGDVSDRLGFVVGVHLFQDENFTGEGGCLREINANIDELSEPPFLDPDETIPNPAYTGFEFECAPDGGTQFDRLGDRVVSGGPGLAGMSGFVENESQAIFGHITYDISDLWTVDFGVRYTDEDRFFNQAEIDVSGNLCTHSQPGDPPVDEICVPSAYIVNYGTLLEAGFYNNIKANYSETTPMLSFTRSLQSDAIDDGIIYFTYAEGFLSGSFNDELNPILVPEIAPLLPYNPEHVFNYEVGFKGTLLDGRLRIAGDVFIMEYEDKQESIGIDNTDGRFGGDPNIAIITNAATVDISGIELELRAQPWDGGFLSLDLGYLNNEYGAFTSFDPDAPGGFEDRSGLTIADYSPEWTLNSTIEHAFQLGNGATLTPQLGWYYQSEYDWVGGIDEGAGDSFCFQDGYSKFRTRLTYEPAGGDWQVSLFGQNITDERYLERCNDGRRSGVYDFRYGRPRTWGVEFVYRMGEAR